MKLVRDKYAPTALYEDSLDGVNLEFDQWRFNLRMSNTELLLRLNVESRADRALLEDKTADILDLLEKMGGAVPAWSQQLAGCASLLPEWQGRYALVYGQRMA